MEPTLPEGLLVGHWTHPSGGTGCTVVLAPDGAVAGCEVRGGGPGTRETDVLGPSSGARDVHAVLLSGGSAFGLAAADGVVAWLAERGHGYLTRAGVRVPLVSAAVVFDEAALVPELRPGPDAGRAACDAAAPVVPARGRVGAGASTKAGGLLGAEHWTRTGMGAATEEVHGALVTALAVVNPVGEVLDERGEVLAGVRSASGPGFERTLDLLRRGEGFSPPPAREATTLIVLTTDAVLDRTGAWLAARAASAGVARAVDPVATPYDGDVAFCLATGRSGAAVDPFALGAAAAWATAAAIRDGARAAAAA